MSASDENKYSMNRAFPTQKIITLEQTLTQSMKNFKELVLEFEQLHLENKNYKKMFPNETENIVSTRCTCCKELEKTIGTKEQILNSIVSVLKKLIETKDFNLIDSILELIIGETNILTPPRSISPQKTNTQHKDHQNLTPLKESGNDCIPISPKKKDYVGAACNNESVSEIEGTPTGRKSPIFQIRKSKASSALNTNSSISKDKKKCPESWLTPDNKSIKLTYPNRSKSVGRLRQGRLNLVKLKSSNIVDLTCSPEYNSTHCSSTILQCNVKNEVIDNDETILPSPTSGPVKFSQFQKIMLKNSPTKFKKPFVASKVKIETAVRELNIENEKINEDMKEIEDSINLLNQYPNRFKSSIKREIDNKNCGNDSISLLQNVKREELKNKKQLDSPNKRPLLENMNITNVQNHENESSISILQRDPVFSKATKGSDDTAKRAKAEVSAVYREPAPRTKAEKRALPGWSCDECKNFYAELYKDNPVMLAQKMDECSKHRGKNNPVRPKTPEGFWNPRWDVPDDTEEFNRRNNV